VPGAVRTVPVSSLDRQGRPRSDRCPDEDKRDLLVIMIVKGQFVLPIGGHEFCPLVAIRTAQ
jgi:hypothetical protein